MREPKCGRLTKGRGLALGLIWLLLVTLLSVITIGVRQGWAQGKDFSSWIKFTEAQLVPETTSFAAGQLATVGLKIKLKRPWHTYWVNPGDSGTPFNLRFHPPAGVQVERVLFPLPQREATGPLVSFAYEDEVLVPIELRLASSLRVGQQPVLSLDAEWLVCSEVCIPANKTLQIPITIANLDEIRPSAEFAQFQKSRALTPTALSQFPRFKEAQEGGAAVELPLPALAAGEEYLDFFPFRNSGVSNAVPTFAAGRLRFEKSPERQADPDRIGVLVVRDAQTSQIKAYEYGNSGWKFKTDEGKPTNDLGWILFSAFIGGLILNLMPCVFPVLSIKLLSLLKLAHAHPGEVRRQNLAYVAGVLVSFMSIALVLSLLRAAGHSVGWGFQLQSPLFLSVLCWLFFVMTLNLLGIFEFELVNPNWGNNLARLGGLTGSFFTGVLAVIVASPCTAPFMGVAIGFGIGQPTIVLLAVFAMLGLGLAFPYLIFVIFPSWVRYLPRPGLWMKIVKQIMAVPLFLTTLWLLWVLQQSRGDSAVFMVAGVCCVLAVTLWLHAWRGLRIALASLALVMGISFIAFQANDSSLQAAETGAQWQPYSEARLNQLKGGNVFVNMTADWCLTCKVNERLVFADQEVQDTLKRKNVIWLKGDWTQRNEEITHFLSRFDRVGVPFYVLYSARSPAGLALPEVLTKSSFMNYIDQEFPN